MDRRPSGGDLRHSGDEQCSTSRRQYAWRRRPIARRKTASAHDRRPGKIVGVSNQGAAVSNRRFVKRRSGERRSLISPRSSPLLPRGEGEDEGRFRILHNQTRTFGQSSRNGIFKSRQTKMCNRCSQGIAQGLLSTIPRSSTERNCSCSSVASSSRTIIISPV